MVAIGAEKIELLRSRLGADAERVVFADMAELGANPARIIPAWQEFVDAHAGPGRPMRGIGEPIWADRSPTELVECQLPRGAAQRRLRRCRGLPLICPYDTAQLDEEVIAEAERSHPYVGGARSGAYRGDHAVPQFAAPLAEPPTVDAGTRDHARVPRRSAPPHGGSGRARRPGPQRVHDLVLSAHEIATNSVRHGGGRGVCVSGARPDALICEVRDSGRIAQQPLVGRVRPSLGQTGGWGLWLANQLCDLVQLRELPHGSVVRLHQRTN